MPDYTITLEDLKQYLAEFGPDDTVGVSRDSTSCLLARALNRKYGIKFEMSHDSFSPWHSIENFETTHDIRHVVIAFDAIAPHGAEVSRKQVEAAIPQLKGE